VLLLIEVFLIRINLLVNAEKLLPGNRDHQLKGTLKDCREWHQK